MGRRSALALDRGTDPFAVTIAASVQGPDGRFARPVAVAPPQFVSDATPARAAVDARGTTTIAWLSGPTPGSSSPTGVFGASAVAGAPFGEPQTLAPASRVTADALTLAAGGAVTELAFVASGGPQATASDQDNG